MALKRENDGWMVVTNKWADGVCVCESAEERGRIREKEGGSEQADFCCCAS